MENDINTISFLDGPAGKDLAQHARENLNLDLKFQIENDLNRSDTLTFSCAEVTADLSRQKITNKTLDLLYAFASYRQIQEQMSSMMQGDEVNSTEGKRASHHLLRAEHGDLYSDSDVFAEILFEREKAFSVADKIRSGDLRGSGGRYETVIHVGIGGSELGTRLLVESLSHIHDGPELRFLSNVDPCCVDSVTKNINPSKTLVVAVSKSFATHETIKNLQLIKLWFKENGCSDRNFYDQLIAVTTKKDKARNLGIKDENILLFPDTIGGRFSFSSSVSISALIAFGSSNFKKILEGARKADAHVQNSKMEDNMPLNLALVDFWNLHGLNMKTRAVIPYTSFFRSYVEYIQQLEMESNGKGVSGYGKILMGQGCPIVWGSCGTNAQHAFFQMLHQSAEPIPVEFVIPTNSHCDRLDSQRSLIANAVAQAEGLLVGRCAEEAKEVMNKEEILSENAQDLLPHRVFTGNRPSTILLLDELSPSTMGTLMALSEHRTLYFGSLIGVNSFDQWGVELGKTLSSQIFSDLDLRGEPNYKKHDLATGASIARIRQMFKK